MSSSVPVVDWEATILTTRGVNQSSYIYITVNLTAGWEVMLPVQVQQSNVSNDPQVIVWGSTDGGANYDTVPLTSFSIARNITAPRISKAEIRLPTGQYLIGLLASGPQSQSFQVLTQMTITAILNA